MKKLGIIGVLAILIFVVGISGCINQTKSYSANGISFDYSTDWQQLSVNSTNSIVTVGVPNSYYSSGYPKTYVTVQKTTLPSSYTLKGAYDQIYAEYATVPGFTTVSDTTTTVDGATAYVNTHTYQGSDALIKEKAVWIEKNGYIYILVCSSPSSDFSNQQANFDTVINSFQVE